MRIERTVSSLPEAVGFYCAALGFEPAGTPDTIEAYGRQMHTARLKLGEQHLWLTSFDSQGDIYPAASTSADLWFQHMAIVATDIEGAYQRLKTVAYTGITQGGPVQLPPETGNVIAYKFRDPDGHPLELIQFPSGTGDARWQSLDTGALTIGVDHAAISVSNTEQSIVFYTQTLGMSVSACQTNKGPEQENLDALENDIVEVTALQPSLSATPHLELLAYVHPRGRATAPSMLPNDIAGDRLVLEVDNLTSILERLQGQEGRIVSIDSRFSTAVVHDPDGHLLVLTAAA